MHPAATKRRGFAGSVFALILRYVAQLAYIAGLAALIPLVIFPTTKAPTYFSAAAGLIIFAVLVIFIQKGSLALTIRSLGRITTIPGILAVLFLMFGRESSVNFALSLAPSLTEPIVKAYIENSIPSVWLLALGFLIVGVILWMLGSRMVRRSQFAEISHFRHRIEHLK
jgi:hypothetical protein